MKYSIVCDTLKWIGYDVLAQPSEILRAIKEAGYDGADLPGDVQRLNVPLMRKLTTDLGLAVPEVLGAWAYFHAGEDRNMAGADEAARRRGIEYSKRALDLAAELGASYFQICAAQPPIPEVPFPSMPIATLRQNFVKAVREICAHAAQRGITVLFEPLNLYEGIPGVLTTLDEGISIINEIGSDRLGLQPDIYHMNISEASIPAALAAAGRHVKVMHMNETNHRFCGAGHADYEAIYRTLKAIGFDGYISVYMPLISQDVNQMTAAGYGRASAAGATTSANRPDLKSVLAQQLTFLRNVERKVNAN